MNTLIPIRIAGIDDATKCPCIGSIFIAGVVADKKTVAYWKKLGVKDSKLVASAQRFKLAKIIKETALCYSIEEITPFMIDDKTFNLNEWEMITVLNIVMDLQKQYVLGDVHIDNWEVTERHFKERFFNIFDADFMRRCHEKNIHFEKEKLENVYFLPEHRADELHTIVGAASILAKTSSDIQYQEYKKIYGDFGKRQSSRSKNTFVCLATSTQSSSYHPYKLEHI